MLQYRSPDALVHIGGCASTDHRMCQYRSPDAQFLGRKCCRKRVDKNEKYRQHQWIKLDQWQKFHFLLNPPFKGLAQRHTWRVPEVPSNVAKYLPMWAVSTLEGTSTWEVHIGGYLSPHWRVPQLERSTLEGTSNFVQKILGILFKDDTELYCDTKKI